jgi:hypothetical protein
MTSIPSHMTKLTTVGEMHVRGIPIHDSGCSWFFAYWYLFAQFVNEIVVHLVL